MRNCSVRPDLWEIYQRNRLAFEVMEDAYIGARHLPRTYSRETVEQLLSVARQLLEACG